MNTRELSDVILTETGIPKYVELTASEYSQLRDWMDAYRELVVWGLI